MNDDTGAKSDKLSRNNRRTKLEDVAARVGLSPASVSLVLNNAPGPSAETRRRVQEAAEQLGYRPDRTASLLARRRRHLIGVTFDVRSTFEAELVEEIDGVIGRFGYDVVLSAMTRNRNEQRAIETLVDFRCEALILLGARAPSARLAALDRQLPIVLIGRRTSESLDVVRTSDQDGIGQVVSHLVQLGHGRIAFLDGGKGTVATDRRNGYRAAMRQYGLGEYIRILPGDLTEQAGIRAAETLLAEETLPTAVVAANDRSAVGLLDALHRANVRVPETISVTGYDDSPLARLGHVNLTTVSQNIQQQAEHAVAAAVERLDNGRTEHSEVVLAPRLIVRGTSGPPRS